MGSGPVGLQCCRTTQTLNHHRTLSIAIAWSFQIWTTAAVQMFFSLGPALGGLITMSSYNNYRRKFNRWVSCPLKMISLFKLATLIFIKSSQRRHHFASNLWLHQYLRRSGSVLCYRSHGSPHGEHWRGLFDAVGTRAHLHRLSRSTCATSRRCNLDSTVFYNAYYSGYRYSGQLPLLPAEW